MKARTKAPVSDLDHALRAAAGVTGADVPRLPQSVIAELAAETVETIAWGYDDGPPPVSPPADRPEAAASLGPPIVRSRRRVALAAVLGVAVVAAGGVTAALIRDSAGPADSSAAAIDWQAVPHPAPSGAARAAAEACIKELDPVGIKYPSLGLKLTDAWLSEQRGRTVFTMLANADAFGACLTLDGRGDGGFGDSAHEGLPHPSATGINLGENGGSWTMDIHDKRVDTTALAGFAGSAVSGITVRRADGLVVTASINDGLWAAWWPGTSKAVSVTVHTRDGHSTTTPIGQVPSLLPAMTGS